MNKNEIAVAILKRSLDMDEFNVKLTNHVKNCDYCLNLMEEASKKCFNHYELVNL